MKYAIRGSLAITDEQTIVNVLNKYTLWKFAPNATDSEYTFEVWLNTLDEKTNLFQELKTFVDQFGEVIDWHECSHDEAVNQPCLIAEEYRG